MSDIVRPAPAPAAPLKWSMSRDAKRANSRGCGGGSMVPYRACSSLSRNGDWVWNVMSLVAFVEVKLNRTVAKSVSFISHELGGAKDERSANRRAGRKLGFKFIISTR